MNQVDSIHHVFTTMYPFHCADLAAVRMKDESYYIYKNKFTKLRGFVDESSFKELLHMSSYPIVLHEEYINMQDIKKNEPSSPIYQKEREDLMERVSDFRFAPEHEPNLDSKTNEEIRKFIDFMDTIFDTAYVD